jgi:hypothetical protein
MIRTLMSYGLALSICFSLSGNASGYTYTEILVGGLSGLVATAINNHGDIVGYGAVNHIVFTNVNQNTAGFLKTGNVVSLLIVPDSTTTTASSINNNGDVVGEYTDAAGSHGFLYSAGVYRTIDAPAPAVPNTTHLTGINNNGQILGYATATAPGTTLTSTDSFVDTNGSFAFVPFGPLEFLTMYGINDSSQIAGSDGGAQVSGAPAYGTANGITRVPNFSNGIFTAINKTSQVILYLSNVSYLQSSPSQTTTGTPVFFPGANQTKANGMNDGGTIAGSYLDTSGNTHAFIASPPASPACSVTGSPSPRQLSFTIQDSSGLGHVNVSASSNAAVSVPSFPAGTTSPVVVTATATDSGLNASVTLDATNTGGGSSSCSSRILTGAPEWLGLGGILISNITAGTDRSGALEAFGLGGDSTLWHITQSGAAGAWGTWQPLGGGGFTSDPAVVLNSDGRLVVLETSSDGTLQSLTQTGPGDWSGASWVTVTTGVKGRPAVVNNSDGILEAYARTTGDAVIQMKTSGPSGGFWTGPTALGGIVTSDPAAVLDANGVMQVFATGTDQSLWNTAVAADGTVYSWSFVGGSLKGNPAVNSIGGTVYVVARGSDDSLMVNSRANGSWAGFQSLGGVLISNPRAAVNSDGRVEVFVNGGDSAVWHLSQTAPGSGQWTPFTTLGGVIRGDVTPAIDSTALLNLFVIGGDSGLWNMTQTVPGSWQ